MRDRDGYEQLFVVQMRSQTPALGKEIVVVQTGNNVDMPTQIAQNFAGITGLLSKGTSSILSEGITLCICC